MKLKENEILILESGAGFDKIASVEELRSLIEKAGDVAENLRAYVARPLKLKLVPSRVLIGRESRERKAKAEPKKARDKSSTATK